MIIAVAACVVAASALTTQSVARIIGLDDRRSVSYLEGERYRAVGVVAVAHGKRVDGGTGTLINDQMTVLTAFHNVYHDGTTGPVGQLQVPLERIFFVVGDRLRSQRTFYRVRSVSPFRQSSDLILPDEDDLAVLTLERPVRGAEPLLLRPLDSEEDGRGLGTVTHVGFHRDRNAGLDKMIQQCGFRERPPMATYPRSVDVLVHDCDSEGNASGSPFLDQDDRIVAVHLGGSPRYLRKPGKPFDPSYNFNVARRITSEVQVFVDKADQDPF